MYSAKIIELGQTFRIRAKGVLFGKSGCIRPKGVVIGQKWLYSGKNGCFRKKRLYSGKSGCGPTATVTSVKFTLIEGPEQAFQGKRLSSKNYAAYAT